MVVLKNHPAAPPTVWLWYPVVAADAAVARRANTARNGVMGAGICEEMLCGCDWT